MSAERHLPRYQSLQPLYNLYDREGFESELQPLCLKEDIGVIPYYALAAGFLTGKYRSEKDLGQSARGGGVGSKYLNERGLRILAALDKVAKAKSATPAQIAHRLADRAAHRHGGDRKRHQREAIRRASEGCDFDARCRCHAPARPGLGGGREGGRRLLT